MKRRIPLITLPIIIFFLSLFLPDSPGDYFLGQLIGIFFVLCLFGDIVLAIIKKGKKKSESAESKS